MSKVHRKAISKKHTRRAEKLKRTLETARVSFWRQLLKAAPVIFIFIVLTIYLEHNGWFKSFETGLLDNWLRFKLNWTSETSGQSSDIIIIAITDEDYTNKELFEGKSPLKQEKVQELIEAIITGKPKAIGVDIDTSSWQQSQMIQLPESPPIVWQRDAEQDEDVYIPLEVLGGIKPEPSHWGIAWMPVDPDKIIRRYRRLYNTYKGFAPSFPLAVARVAGNVPVNENELSAIKETEWSLDFLGPPDRFVCISASEILKAYSDMKARKGQDRSSPNKLDKLNNRIVLIGGFYEAGRDIHDTPLGQWAGVELMAQAIETEMKRGHPLPNELWVILLGIAGSFGLVFLDHRVGWKWGLPISLLAIVVLAPLFSYLTTSTPAHWVYFIPIMAAVLMRELYEYFKEYWKTRIKQLYDHSK